ncbi:Nucleotide-binding, alpha-beta plait [Cynara cardunculus var. scolymus]|uniref:Nucleotide-binding, alpha-beta plait n=1 Tax=Cynara cardunculus var. scolymus TaxID=59895 RepID=A0A103Y237_CYNCS|nr:Nucleotide-binding, alpha-beta plait [Cynara cardunculus var. scolymus]
MQPATTAVMDPRYQQQWMMMNQQQPPPPQQQYHQQQPQQMYTYNQQPPPAAAVPPVLPQYPVAATAGTGPNHQPASADEIRTLWIGDLQYWMDEQYLVSCFAQSGEVISAKVIRNKQTGQSEGYGFIEFVNRPAAERHLQTYNGTLMPNVEQNFRLNWASFGVGEKRADGAPDFTIFVGDLAADVTDYTLQETFRAHYPSVKGAKVVTDRMTGRTKGYGFVKFGDETEQLHAMTEMNGRLCSTRPMRIGPAANKNTVGGQQYPKGHQGDLSCKGLALIPAEIVTPILHTRIPKEHRTRRIQLIQLSCAEEALRMLQGTQLGGQTVRLSWGRSPSNKQPQQVEQSQYSGGGGYYGYGQGYETYGYAPVAQDPTMYYGGYAAGYGGYPQVQQQPQPQIQPQPQQHQ